MYVALITLLLREEYACHCECLHQHKSVFVVRLSDCFNRVKKYSTLDVAQVFDMCSYSKAMKAD